MDSLIFLAITILIALIFEFTNAFHDTANAIATVVGTKILTPKKAIILATIFNLIGALLGSNVAKTITSGLTYQITSEYVIISALISAITWNLITWYFGIPSSSSHALIGGLLGSAIASSNFNIVKWDSVISKIFIPLMFSPIIGFVIALILMRIINSIKINEKWYNKLQILSSALVAFAHGNNDAQKTMGIITLSLISFGYLGTQDIPFYVKITCAIVMAIGTAVGGWRIIDTLGNKITQLKPKQGFSAQISSATIMESMSYFGIPISTTHVISTSVIGAGASEGKEAVNWSVVINMLIAWLVTLPITALLGAFIHNLLN